MEFQTTLKKSKVKLVCLTVLFILCNFWTLHAQGVRISGTVIDDTGETLPGVTVLVKGTTTGQATDENGKYSLTVPDNNAVLVFSYVGYITQEIAVAGRQTINITMSEDVTQIDEVVVVGYGQQKKTTLTGSVSQVDGNEIASRQSGNVVTALQGMMPGVSVIRSSGQPGSLDNGVRVRGFSSVNEVSALILIDGMEGNLGYLNPEDIANVSVLKDAASASIYGSRAAGGVILVTTKKGAAQKVRISYNGSFGISVPGLMPQRMPPWEEQEYIQTARTLFNNAVELQPDAQEWLGNPNYLWDLHATAGNRWGHAFGNTNWIYEGLRENTTAHRHSVSINGGHGLTTYFISAGYNNQKGLFKYGPDSNDRYNLRLNLKTEMNKYLEFNLRASYENNINYRNSVGHEDLMAQLYNNRGRMPLYNPEIDSNYETDPYGNDLHVNPIRSMKFAGSNTTANYYFTGAGALHIKNLLKGLTIDLSASRRFGVYSQEIDRVFLMGNGRNGANTAQQVNGPSSSVQKVKNTNAQDKLEALVNYRLDIDKHAIAVLGGASYEQWTRDQIDARANGLLSNELFSFNFYDSGEGSNSILSDLSHDWKIASLFGRINYGYANRYLLELVARYDGSSRLEPGNRFGFFPGVSAGWVISEESFFEGIKDYVSFFKLRVAYGEVGNSTVLNSRYYPYIGTIDRSGNRYMGERWYYRRLMPSAGVTWETVSTTNAGIDLAFLKRRLSLMADYYWKTNHNMLSPMAPGNIVGVEALPSENVGTLKTWGWEISLGWRDKIGDLRYNLSFNLHDSQNELTDYKGINGIAAGNVRLLEGYPLNTLWGYETNGFWNSAEEYLAYKTANPGYETFAPNGSAPIGAGDTRYVNQGKADHMMGSIGSQTPDDPGDLVYLGDANPRYEYGINFGLEWKGFDFSCFFQGVGKRNFFVRSQSLMPLGASSEMPWTIHRDHWSEDNPNAYFARIYESATHNYQYADRWVQNGAYLRLKNIQLGYRIPLQKYVQSLRIYVTGNDVWEHTNMLKSWDPEFSNQVETRTGTSNINDRVNRNYYPFMRSWTVGVNLTF